MRTEAEIWKGASFLATVLKCGGPLSDDERHRLEKEIEIFAWVLGHPAGDDFEAMLKSCERKVQ